MERVLVLKKSFKNPETLFLGLKFYPFLIYRLFVQIFRCPKLQCCFLRFTIMEKSKKSIKNTIMEKSKKSIKNSCYSSKPDHSLQQSCSSKQTMAVKKQNANNFLHKNEASRNKSKRPREESSTKPPPKLRQIKGLECAAKQRNTRFDPRFSSSCGQFDEFRFHQDYAFLDQLRQEDIQELKKAFRKAKSEGNTVLSDRIRLNLLRLTNQQKTEMERQKREQIRAELRRENIQRMNRGERPIYLNNIELSARASDAKI